MHGHIHLTLATEVAFFNDFGHNLLHNFKKPSKA